MIEAVMLWNEPNNKSHWDPEIDPDWSRFAEMAILAGDQIRMANLCVESAHTVNGVSDLHSGIIRSHMLCHKSGNHSCKHISRSGLCHCRITGGIDHKPSLWRFHKCPAVFQYTDSMDFFCIFP